MKTEFESTIVLEHSFTGNVDEIGKAKCEMELIKDSDSVAILWNIEFVDDTLEPEEILMQIEVQEGTMNVTGYDGVFELPKEAIELLNQNGYNTQEVE